MVSFMVATFLSLFGWTLLLVMMFMQAVIGGAYQSGRDRHGRLKNVG